MVRHSYPTFGRWDQDWGNFEDLFTETKKKEKRKKRRTPIPISTVKKLLIRSKGKCEKCPTSLSGLMPDFHHKNEDPSDNSMINILVLCPNCHRKETMRLKYKGKKTSLKTTKKKTAKKKTTKRKKKPPYNPLRIPKIEIPRIEF